MVRHPPLAGNPASPIIYHYDARAEGRRRAIDLAIVLTGLLALWPLMLLVAAAIWIEDHGPVLFVQRRVGRYGRLFVVYKFRTMRVGSCSDMLKPSEGADRRITRVGRILRKTSIDELPQIFNVLNGTMALVGPRPEMPFIVRQYERWQHLRHLVKPGITGLWQATCRSRIPLHHPEATRIDLDYISRASARTDAYIIGRTVVALLAARGAV